MMKQRVVALAILSALASMSASAIAVADETKAAPTKAKAKAKAQATEKAADKATDKGTESAKPTAPAPNGEPSVAGKISNANDAADVAAGKANADVVGVDAQRLNETKAETARPKTDDDKEAHDAARAIGRATTSAADWVATGVEDATHATDKPGKYDPFAVEWSPLGLISGGRVSLNVEWAPVTHNAIVVSPHIVHTTADIALDSHTTTSQAFTGVGGEIGYRYYTGRRGMNGVFVGPSVLAGVYNAGLPDGNQAFTNVGLALDLGLQEIFWNHVVVGGGVGIEYLNVSHDFHDLPGAPAQIASTGLKPRLLFEAGYGF